MIYEIFWVDLTEEAQSRLKHLYHNNINTTPIAIIEVENKNKQ